MCGRKTGTTMAIWKLAIIAGMRQGEIFGSPGVGYRRTMWRSCNACISARSTHRNQPIRAKGALPTGLADDIVVWREFAADTKPQAFVFASERKTPLAKENVWRRNILSRLLKIGLEWANFQLMRRTHASIMKQLDVDPKWVADQLEHSLDVARTSTRRFPLSRDWKRCTRWKRPW